MIWSLGCLAATLLVVGIVFMQAGPDWYMQLFIASAIYCTGATVASRYLGRPQGEDAKRSAWLQALSSGRLGFLAVLATAAFILLRVAVALVRK